jgi:outer membrane usher protein FimD/PapC
MEKFTPFGFHYSGNSVSIKLRLHPIKFQAMNIDNTLGNWRYTRNGYVLFETTLDTKSDEYLQLTTKLNSHK